MANVRIIEQPEITTLSGGEYLVTDSPTAGTKKITPQNLVEAAGGGSGTGVSDELKTALLQLASKVAYIDDDGQEYYDDLYNALYDTTWQVTNTLTHCSSSNSAESVTKNGSYSATITASVGYTLAGATVSITMGGTDITASAYNNGTISIASVTGALVISISAAAKTVSSISAVYTQSGTVYDTDSLDSLKADLVVTATYSDTSTATVPSTDYTLSGTLTAGTSTVTVSYESKTTTFNVTVSSARAVFGTFVNGHAASKGTVGNTAPNNSIWISAASARAAFSTPIVNNGYVLTVTDSSKYNLVVYDVSDNTPIPTAASTAVEGVYYVGGTKSISWKTSDSATTPYILVSLKKMDNTAFTDAELANGAEEVFTYTTT